MWSRTLSNKMGLEQEDFIKAFIIALKDKRVIETLESSISGQLTKEVGELRKLLQERDHKITALEDEVDQLKEKVDFQEQYTRRNNLRITGVPERENEDILKTTLDLINNKVCVSSPICEADIDRVHRLGKPRIDGTYRPVMVRFATYRTRQHVYRHRLHLNPRRTGGGSGNPWAAPGGTGGQEARGAAAPGAGVSDLQPPGDTTGEATSEATELGRGTGNGNTKHLIKQTIFINEDLTKEKSQLLWYARIDKRNDKIKDCWSADGTILIKDCHNRIKTVKNLQELRSISGM